MVPPPIGYLVLKISWQHAEQLRHKAWEVRQQSKAIREQARLTREHAHVLARECQLIQQLVRSVPENVLQSPQT